MFLLVQFLTRLSFGMATAMSATSPQRIASGYYRNNCYVLLGVNLLAALALWSDESPRSAAWPILALAAAAISYLGAVLWLYEKPRGGILALKIIAGLSGLIAATMAWKSDSRVMVDVLWIADAVVSAQLLGITIAAMLLGHWYLNAPGMQIEPLQKLVRVLGAAVAARAVVSGIGLASSWGIVPSFEFVRQLMLVFRWLTAVGGAAVIVGMTLATLRIPNTQAATGLLYVAVVFTFLGELLGQLLSAGAAYPL